MKGLSFDVRRFGLAMQQWHSSQGDPIYAVGSSAFAGRLDAVSRETLEWAMANLSGAGSGARERAKLRACIREILALTDPKPRSGYCYELSWSKCSPWTTPDTAWQIGLAGDTDEARYLGQREIDGTVCDVWREAGGTCIAQTANGTGAEEVLRQDPSLVYCVVSS